jgi:hypothetical protein
MPQVFAAVPAAVPRESTTCAAKGKDPDAVGVPMMAPVDEFSVRPAGRLPEVIEYVYGATPPVAFRLELYGTPTCPAVAAHASVGVATAIVMPHEFELVPAAVPRESTTCAVKGKAPGAVGVPVMAPVDGFSVRPVGKLPDVIENA